MAILRDLKSQASLSVMKGPILKPGANCMNYTPSATLYFLPECHLLLVTGMESFSLNMNSVAPTCETIWNCVLEETTSKHENSEG